jgi:hypothetical protein
MKKQVRKYVVIVGLFAFSIAGAWAVACSTLGSKICQVATNINSTPASVPCGHWGQAWQTVGQGTNPDCVDGEEYIGCNSVEGVCVFQVTARAGCTQNEPNTGCPQTWNGNSWSENKPDTYYAPITTVCPNSQ